MAFLSSHRQRRIGPAVRWAVVLACSLWLQRAAAQPAMSVAREYDLKAAFIFNFTKFIDWPVASFAAPQAPFVIAILGEDPFEGSLDRLVAGEAVGGHPVQVHRCSHIQEALHAHIIFIDASHRRRLKPILQTLRGRPVLTVGDEASMSENGTVTSFRVDGDRLRLRFNLEAAKEADLKISSKLLRLSEIVESSGNG